MQNKGDSRTQLFWMMLILPNEGKFVSGCRPETFELLAYTLTVQKLVDAFGYPEVSCSEQMRL